MAAVLVGAGCGPGNQPPRIQGLTANPPAVVEAGVEVRLQVDVSDPDEDAFTVAWSQLSPDEPKGAFRATDGLSTTWTAPAEVASRVFVVRAVATDARGASTSVSIELSGNRPPVVAEAFANPAAVPSGGQIALEVVAHDEDGDSLQFLWNQLTPAWPQGSFFTPRENRTLWTAPVVTVPTPVQLRVQVLDDRGARVERLVEVLVQKPNEAPSLVNVQGPTAALAGELVTLHAVAQDSDGDPLTFTWSQTSPTLQGTFVSGRNEATATWRSSELTAGAPHVFTVTVTDGKSPPVSRTVSVFVTIPRYGPDIQPIWTAHCVSCHSGPSAQAGLTLTAGASYAALVNAPTLADGCKTLKRVNPSNPDLSSLVLKITDVACGSRMPKDDPAHFDRNPGEVVRIRAWVRAGAFQN